MLEGKIKNILDIISENINEIESDLKEELLRWYRNGRLVFDDDLLGIVSDVVSDDELKEYKKWLNKNRLAFKEDNWGTYKTYNIEVYTKIKECMLNRYIDCMSRCLLIGGIDKISKFISGKKLH